MKKIVFLFFLYLTTTISLRLSAQDPCASAIKLQNVNNYCSTPKGHTNVGTTPSTFTTPACWNNTNSNQDVWFKFTATGTDVQVTLVTGGANGTIKNANIQLIGDCSSTNITELGCTRGTKDTVMLYKGGLTPGKDYYIRIASTDANKGTFKLCVDSYTPPANPGADCSGAVKLCDIKQTVHVGGLSGGGTNTLEGIGTCLEDESNSCWYYWVCGKAGTLTFDLKPNDPLNDIDFVLYSSTSANFCQSKKLERCCASSCIVNNGSTGLNTSSTDVTETYGCDGVKDAYVKSIDMVVGTTYAILINNFSASSGFDITFGGTGEFQGPVAKITADKLIICEGESITFTSSSTNFDNLQWNFTSGGTPASSPTTPGPHVIKYETPGNYVAILNAKNSLGCVSTDVVNITVNEAPTVIVDSKEVCEGEEATLTATPSVPGGTYSWTPGTSSSSTLKDSPVMDQTYTVTYKLAGCEATGMGTITVNPKPQVTVNSEDICPGTDATLTATLKETVGTYTYSWSTGANTKSITVSPITQTSYTVTVKSAQGCVGTAVATVDVNGKMTVDAGKDTTICKGATVNLMVMQHGTGYTYNWTASGGTVSDPAIYNPTATPEVTTTYTVEVTSDKGCSGTGTVTVNVDPLMTPVLTTKNVECNATCDGEINVNVTGGTPPYTYGWNSGCDKASCSSLCAGSYTVTITDKLGCTIKKDTTLTEPTAIAIQTSSVSSVCGKANGSASVTATGGTGTYTYLWDDPAKQTTATATGLSSKKYCVTVTDANGCKKTDCIDVADQPGINASLVSVTPASCNATCDGTAEVTVSGGTAPYTYSWNTTPGAQTNAKATGLCAGDYIATITDNIGCTDTVQVKVSQPQPITLEPVNPVTICIGSNATLMAVGNGGDGNYTYDWSPESTETTKSITVFPVVTTEYHVKIKDGKGCPSAPLTIKVIVNPPLKVIASADVSLCVRDSASLSIVEGSGGNGGPYTYTWSPGMLTGSKVTVKPTATTTYTVTIKDNCGTPTAIDSVKVTINEAPVVSFNGGPLQGCSPLTVNFKDSTTVINGVITNWKWDFGDQGGSDSKDPTFVFTANGTKTNIYSVTLTVKSSNGCVSTLTKKDWIKVFPIPTAAYEAPVSNSILNPTVHFTNTSVGATSWEWDFGDTLSDPLNNTSKEFSPNHTYSSIGEYCVKLVVKNMGGCTSDITKCLTIDPQFVLYIPNAFTPNDDGDNDVFYAKGKYINEFEMRIFDRWGNMIYYANSMDKPWNGGKNNTGEIVQQDVYVYQITIRDNKDKRHKYVGTVTLIKGG